jgi:hypothetical protein
MKFQLMKCQVDGMANWQIDLAPQTLQTQTLDNVPFPEYTFLVWSTKCRVDEMSFRRNLRLQKVLLD